MKVVVERRRGFKVLETRIVSVEQEPVVKNNCVFLKGETVRFDPVLVAQAGQGSWDRRRRTHRAGI